MYHNFATNMLHKYRMRRIVKNLQKMHSVHFEKDSFEGETKCC
jgi:hypothetical protein